MKTIRIIVPKKGEKWRLSMNSGMPLLRNDASVIYNTVERRLLKRSLASQNKDKIKVSVNYVQVGGFDNQGVYDTVKEALYALICFLEDFVTTDFLKTKEKRYTL